MTTQPHTKKFDRAIRQTGARLLGLLTLIATLGIPTSILAAIWLQPKWQLFLTGIVLIPIAAALYGAAEGLRKNQDAATTAAHEQAGGDQSCGKAR